jgi:hypothetical protein
MPAHFGKQGGRFQQRICPTVSNGGVFPAMIQRIMKPNAKAMAIITYSKKKGFDNIYSKQRQAG